MTECGYSTIGDQNLYRKSDETIGGTNKFIRIKKIQAMNLLRRFLTYGKLIKDYTSLRKS